MRTALVLALMWLSMASLPAQEVLPDGTQAGLKELSKFKVPAGMKVELFAAEPKLASPVAICVDEKNRVFVAEEYRFNRGTEENRTRPFLLEDDLQIKTLDDRLAVFKKYADKFDGGMNWFSKVSDQVRLLEDSNGDGVADQSTIFAGKFNEPLDGLAAGVIARNGNVYLTCIPHLWLLKDKDGDGIADERTPLLTGFGVNCGFLGHDLHGLAWGPDGKLYFSVGDRGFHVTSKEGRTFSLPRRGAVFRCDPDGSNFEVVHIGLRNPQEIAFDEFGNLFAADNNCDKGDHSRLVLIVDGADSGWNMAYQTIPAPYLTGPWHAEKLWHIEAADQPAWVLPPCGKLGAGPSGFAYYPGTGLDERYQHHFFMANYTGRGGIESFSIKPKGARFEITDEHDFFKPINATDIEFGYDGKVYVADFVNLDWSGKALGGRVFTLSHTEQFGSDVVKQTRNLFAAGIEKQTPERLLELFAHPDMRVRLRAQYAYVDAVFAAKDAAARAELITKLSQQVRIAKPDSTSASRSVRHAMWALGQISRREPAVLETLRPLIKSDDAEVRGQALKLLGEARDFLSHPEFFTALKDEQPRVRFMAAMALARWSRPVVEGASVRISELGWNEAVPDNGSASNLSSVSRKTANCSEVTDMLRRNADADPYLRHAGMLVLANGATVEELEQHAVSVDSPVRLAVLLAARRLVDPQHDLFSIGHDSNGQRRAVDRSRRVAAMKLLESFLNDADPRLVTEAARAINDVPVDAAMPALARLIDRVQTSPATVPEALTRRIINANFRAGQAVHTRAIASLVTLPQLAANMRAEALSCLADWEQPSSRDRVTGIWRPLMTDNAQRAKDIQSVLTQDIAALLGRTEGELQTNVLKLIGRYSIKVDDVQIAGWAAGDKQPVGTRVESLRLLAVRKSKSVDGLVVSFLKSNEPRLRSVARDVLATSKPDAAIASIQAGLADEKLVVAEAQDAVRTLAAIKQPTADALLGAGLRDVVTNDVPKSPWAFLNGAAHLDLLEAASARGTDPLKTLLKQHEDRVNQQTPTDPLARFRVTLVGGDAVRGQSIYRGHPQAQCIRCHKIKGDGGDAGPDLTEVAKRGDRVFLLESLIDPHAKIAKGFGTISFVMTAGQVLSGVIESESKDEVVIVTATREKRRLKPADIEERTAPKSAMPGVRDTLPLRDIRDLVEFLSTLK